MKTKTGYEEMLNTTITIMFGVLLTIAAPVGADQLSDNAYCIKTAGVTLHKGAPGKNGKWTRRQIQCDNREKIKTGKIARNNSLVKPSTRSGLPGKTFGFQRTSRG